MLVTINSIAYCGRFGNITLKLLLRMYDVKKWSQATIQKVWEMARQQGVENERKGFRRDDCGAWMLFSEHGNRDSKYGWEIDHIVPVALDGTDVLSNLQPLHWRNNVEKGDSRTLKCAVTA